MNENGLLRPWRALVTASEAVAGRTDHAELRQRLAALARLAPAQWVADCAATAGRVAAFRDALQGDGIAALESALCPTESEEQFLRWAAGTTRTVFALAMEVAEIACARAAGDRAALAQAGAALASAFIVGGDSIKWHAFAGLATPGGVVARANRAFAVAEAAGLAALESEVDAGGSRLAVPLSGLYARVLLLEIASSGQLGRQQVEIADSWLLRWVRRLPLTRQPSPVAKRFWVDLARTAGLRAGGDPGTAASVRYLGLEVLPELLDTVVRAFHAGCVYPGEGAAARFRLEEHVGVLDFAQANFERLVKPGPMRRAERKAMGGAQVEAFVGIANIVSHALRGGPRAPRPEENAAAARAASRHSGFEYELEVEHRWLRLHDASGDGLGLVASAGEQSDIAVGDLLGVDEPGGTLAVGEVVRRRTEDERGGSRVGLRVLTRGARAVSLHRLAQDGGRGSRDADAIYVPMGGPRWPDDALLVGATAFSPGARYEVRFPDAAFVVALGPVRRRGRGWIATAFEAIEKRDAPDPRAA